MSADIIPLDARRELTEARAELTRMRTMLQHLLVAPWSGARGFVITAACIELGHVEKWDGSSDCVCGRVKFTPDRGATP